MKRNFSGFAWEGRSTPSPETRKHPGMVASKILRRRACPPKIPIKGRIRASNPFRVHTGRQRIIRRQTCIRTPRNHPMNLRRCRGALTPRIPSITR